jgi:hypothetical protein
VVVAGDLGPSIAGFAPMASPARVFAGVGDATELKSIPRNFSLSDLAFEVRPVSPGTFEPPAWAAKYPSSCLV